MPAILEFEQTCNQRAYSVVIIERQLRHVNFQAGRIEANLEALFVARDKQVHLMKAQQKYTCHGLHLPPQAQEDTFRSCQTAGKGQDYLEQAPAD